MGHGMFGTAGRRWQDRIRFGGGGDTREEVGVAAVPFDPRGTGEAGVRGPC